MAEEFSFEIKEHLGVISESKNGWKMELNLVSWGGRDAKFDIRSWSADHKKMGKGITFTKEELESLNKILSSGKL
ncbi:MAG: YdbC family protein [Treponemataceae bacterium]